MSPPFHRRFNINLATGETEKRFVNRIQNEIIKLAQEINDQFSGPGNQFGGSRILDPLMIEVETHLGEAHAEYILDNSKFAKRWKALVGDTFYICLQAVEGLYDQLRKALPPKGQEFKEAVTQLLSMSEEDLGVTWQDGIFTKKGAGVLDEALVNEPLRWLTGPKYENVLVPFRKGLEHFLEGEKKPERFADAITDMYEAIEALAKIVTERPSKDLSANRELFITKLGLTEPYKRMLKEYVDYGSTFRHAAEGMKPKTWPMPHEAEAFVYLTGLFIRLAIESQKK